MFKPRSFSQKKPFIIKQLEPDLCLDCCDFPPGVIMLLMGYTNSHSVENRRYVIARRLGYKIKDLVMNKLTSGNQGPGETRL